ncbi:MAG: hypothetical protein ABUL60_10240 [Myxococcales bacterium]
MPRLFAFIPAIERPRAVGELLSEGLPGVAVTAFGRFADFSAAVASEKPEGALSLADTLRVLGVSVGLQGVAGGSTSEPYVLLAKDPNQTVDSLAKQSIGIVDVVGRAELPLLLKRLLGLTQPPQVRRVLKVSDLLPLLHLDLAPAVTLPERFHGEFQKQSRLELRALRPATAYMGRSALGFPTGRPDRIIANALRRAPASVQSLLGTEAWQ